MAGNFTRSLGEFTMPTFRKIAIGVLAGSGALAAALTVGPVLATPGSGFAPNPIVTGKFGPLMTISHKDPRWPTWDLLFKTKDDTDLGVDVLTIQPGGYSGWHSHAGPIYVTVKTGAVRWYNGETCSFQTFNAGDSYIEESHQVHLVENAYDGVTTLVAVAPRPHGAPGRLDAPEPACVQAD
jgi:quercetin dioxygenase-like cupin family protein